MEIASRGMHEAREQAQWREWLDEHGATFLLFARQKTRSEADAQDLVQESVLEAAQRQKDGQPPAVALVFATIRRRAVDRARTDDRRVRRENATFEGGPESWF